MNRTLILPAALAIALLLVGSFAKAKDKKEEERIANLEAKVEKLSKDLDTVDAAARMAFKKVGAALSDLTDLDEEMNSRLIRLERSQRTASYDGPDAKFRIEIPVAAVRHGASRSAGR